MIDSHSHVDADAFDTDRADVLARAWDAGIQWLVDPGCDVASSRKALALARQDARIHAAVGIHPHSATEATSEALRDVEAMASDPRVVAIGETGLDYHYTFSPAEAQRESLRQHVRLARRVGKPLILHCREAEDDLFAILAEEDASQAGGVVHCFTGTSAAALQLVAAGYYIGITGIVSFKKSDQVQETAGRVPLDRLLVETDAPYLVPIPHRGRRNEPAYLTHTIAAIARLRGLAPEEIAAATAANAARLFRITG